MASPPAAVISAAVRSAKARGFTEPDPRDDLSGLDVARKALILDLVRSDVRARGVGLYYLLRSLAIAPAATVGGLFWKVSPATPFLIAAVIGAVGVLLFTLTVDERHAG